MFIDDIVRQRGNFICKYVLTFISMLVYTFSIKRYTVPLQKTITTFSFIYFLLDNSSALETKLHFTS